MSNEQGIDTVAEPIFLRVRRVLSASAEDGVDALERASGGSVLREAIRQVDRALDEVRVEQEAAVDRGAHAKRRQERIRERLADLDEKARFALSKGRDDLAEAALASQLDLEAELARLDSAQADAAEQKGRLDSCVAELAARKQQMEKELAAFEAARRDARFAEDGTGGEDRRIQRKVDRAQQTFDRVLASAGAAGAGRPDDKEAEIDALRREAAVADRLAALRAAAAKRRPAKSPPAR